MAHRKVVGIHAVKEALKVRASDVVQVHLKQGWESHPGLKEIGDICKSKKVRLTEVGDKSLSKIASSHQGVAAEVGSAPELDWSELKSAHGANLIVLDGIEDPHNLGAIMRTAWLMGAQGILTPDHKSVGLSPIVAKVASGGAEHVPLVPVGNLSRNISDLKELGFWAYGLSHKARQSLWATEFPEKVIWVIGAGGKGMRRLVEQSCDVLVSIPQCSPVASYNASVAAAIALAETCRQQSRG